jgi:hypothetical protein
VGRLACRRERLGHQVVERLAVGVPLLVRLRELTELGVAEVGVILLDGVHGIGDGFEPPQSPAFADAENLIDDRHG